MARDPDPSPSPDRGVGLWAWNGTDWEALRVNEEGILLADSRWWETDEDDVALSPRYYSLTDKDGAWVIIEETSAAGIYTYRYAVGTTGYLAAWTGRGLLVYGYPYEVF
jgi:hypothetical protein